MKKKKEKSNNSIDQIQYANPLHENSIPKCKTENY